MDFLAQLTGRLQHGEWTAGQRLPSIRKMAAAQGVRPHTVVSAYAQLVAEGLLQAQQGRGFFVSHRAQRLEPAQALPPTGPVDPLFQLLQAPANTTKLGCGWLPLPWRDTEALAKAVRKTARSGHSALVEYGDIQGYYPLRKQLSVHLRQHTQIDLSPQQILTSLGATQALDWVSHLLITPGDHVLVDEPCSGNLVKLIELHGGIVVGVPRRKDGPDVAALDQRLQTTKVKAFFCNSTYHNPTGGGLSHQVAFKVLQRAIAHDFLIVEDDVYGDFCPGIHPTFAQLDDFAHVIYIGSFSKSLSASLRIGYIGCSPQRLEALTQLKLLTSVAVPGFCERFLHTILAEGTYVRHAQALQRQLMTQQALGQKVLKQYGWDFDIAPEGGMFVWAGHPDMEDLSDYIGRLAAKGLLLMPGQAFGVSQDFRNRTRINVAHLSQAVAPYFDPKYALRC